MDKIQVLNFSVLRIYKSLRLKNNVLKWFFIFTTCTFLTLIISLPVIAQKSQKLGVVSFTPRLITLKNLLGRGNGVDLNVAVAVPKIADGSATVETNNPFTYFSFYIWPNPSDDPICAYGTPEDVAGISALTLGRNLTFQGRAGCNMGEGYYLGAYQARVTDNKGIYPSTGQYRDMNTIQTLVANS